MDRPGNRAVIFAHGGVVNSAVDFAAQASDVFDTFAVPCTVTRGSADPVASRCVRDDGVERIGEYGQVIGRVTRLSFLKAEWDPARGDIVTFGDGSAKPVETIDSDDGYVVEVVLHG